jgi:hypothetical protein
MHPEKSSNYEGMSVDGQEREVTATVSGGILRITKGGRSR